MRAEPPTAPASPGSLLLPQAIADLTLPELRPQPVALSAATSRWTIGLLIALMAVVPLLMPFDARLAEAIAAAAPPGSWLRLILKWSRYLFTAWSYVGLAAILVWQADRVRLLIGFAVALVGSFGAVHLLKLVAGRARPSLDFGPWYFQPFGDARLGYDSFPSAHTAAAFVLVALLVIYYGRWSWLLLLPALMTGLSRVAQERHYVSDVLLGATLPVIVVLLVQQRLGTRYFRRLNRPSPPGVPQTPAE